jgi:hypothetical protein
MDANSSRPRNSPHKTPNRVEKTIVEARNKHPAWGARKLKRWLETQGSVDIPAVSAITEILKRN